MQIAIFGNPYCNPCAELHKKLHIFEGYEIVIRYIFTSFRPEYNNINKYLIAAYQQFGEEDAADLYNRWYDDRNSRDCFGKQTLDREIDTAVQFDKKIKSHLVIN